MPPLVRHTSSRGVSRGLQRRNTMFYDAAEYPVEFHASPEKMRARQASFDRRLKRNTGGGGGSRGSAGRVASAAAAALQKQNIERRVASISPEMREKYRKKVLYRLNMQKQQASMNRLANAMNLGWGGAASRVQLQKAAGPAARARWQVAGSGAQFLASVSSAWDAVDSLLRTQGGITGTTQRAMAAYMAQMWEQQRWVALTGSAAITAGGACGVPRFIALGAGLWMRDSIGATCKQIDTRAPGFTARIQKFEKMVESGAMGMMTPLWKAAGPTVVSLLPLQIFLWLFKGLIERQFIPEAAAKFINWKAIDGAVGRHKALIGEFLAGRRVDMKPVAMAMAGVVNRCTVYEIIKRTIPGFQPPSECR